MHLIAVVSYSPRCLPFICPGDGLVRTVFLMRTAIEVKFMVENC